MRQYTLIYLASTSSNPSLPPFLYDFYNLAGKEIKMAGYGPETVGLLIKSLSETTTELSDIERKK